MHFKSVKNPRENRLAAWEWLSNRTFQVPDDFDWLKLGISFSATAAAGALLLPVILPLLKWFM